MKKEKLILIGGGGHCKACIDVIEDEGKYEIVGILDVKEKVGKKILNYKIIGTDADIPVLAKKYTNFFVSLGQLKSYRLREKIYNVLKQYNVTIPVIISPKAHVSKYSKIQDGTIVMHNATINPDSTIGKMCIINSGAIVEHDNIVSDFCHISIGAVLGGTVTINKGCFVGGGSFIYNNCEIAEDSIVAAGSVVTRTIIKSGIISGNPAKIVK